MALSMDFAHTPFNSVATCRRIRTISNHLVSSTADFNEILTPSIDAYPQTGLYDEKVVITLSGLTPGGKVTIHGQSTLEEREKIIFASCGHYVADQSGHVDITKHKSLGGTYTGVESMGIIWSLRPAPGYPQNTRMAINFTDRPRLISLDVYSGHLELSEIYTKSPPQSLASVELQRWFKSKDVVRIEIEEGNVRGALFLPAGDGPFQGVIDMFGSIGGLIEYRAALLASRGFAVLALSFFGYKDLPPDLDAMLLNQQYGYFEEAISWLSSHPKILKDGIGVMGVSKAAEFALCMGAFSPKVTAVVSINGMNMVCFNDLYHEGKVKLKGAGFANDEIQITSEGLDLRKSFLKDGDFIPIWEGRAKHLMLVSLDDGQVDVTGYDTLYKVCPDEKKPDIEIVKYPGAGHLLEPPYNPLCRTSIHKAIGLDMLWGGQPLRHARAQEESWQKILTFFQSNIPK